GATAAQYIPLVVSCNFFAVYGPDRPIMGRLLQAEDCAPSDAAPVAVVGETFWRTTLAANPNVIGSPLVLNHRTFTVVGVMPSGSAGQLRGPIWVPLSSAAAFFDGRDFFRERDAGWLLGLVGRLRPGASRAAASAELSVIARQLDAAAPERRATT